MEDPEAQLERVFTDDILRLHGHDPFAVRLLPEAEVISCSKPRPSTPPANWRSSNPEPTTFTISTERTERAECRRNRHLRRILVVDDESLIRWSLVETLSDSGDEVVAVIDAESAVQAVTDSAVPFDVALLDFRLPDSNDLTLVIPSAPADADDADHSHDRVRHAGDRRRRPSTSAPIASSTNHSR